MLSRRCSLALESIHWNIIQPYINHISTICQLYINHQPYIHIYSPSIKIQSPRSPLLEPLFYSPCNRFRHSHRTWICPTTRGKRLWCWRHSMVTRRFLAWPCQGVTIRNSWYRSGFKHTIETYYSGLEWYRKLLVFLMLLRFCHF